MDDLDKQLYGNDLTAIYGPYIRKEDGRKHVILYNSAAKVRTTLSYPKYLVERMLGRVLIEPETVDHINKDFTDDRLENLRVLDRVTNACTGRKHKVHLINTCKQCATKFRPQRQTTKYCSNKCKYQAQKL